MIKQLPISLKFGRKRDVRSQFAALCYRIKNDKLQFLLITSRGTGRWIIPKGWPMDGRTPAQSAACEAWEEAGVRGKVYDVCLGLYSYRKLMDQEDDLPCLALVYPIKVQTLATDFPEVKERQRKWVSRKKAAKMVAEPELTRILLDFKPKLLV